MRMEPCWHEVRLSSRLTAIAIPLAWPGSSSWPRAWRAVEQPGSSSGS